MKVLHIAATVKGGAGQGLVRLHNALREAGAESQILCADADEDAAIPDVIHARPDEDSLSAINPHAQNFKSAAWELAFYRGRSVEKFVREAYGTRFSPVQTRFRIGGEPCVLDADIVNLHWINGFLDIPSFFRNCHKPIVWTMRDENPLLGGFHYRSSMPAKMSRRLAQIDNEQFTIKRCAIAAHGNVSFMAMSQEMAEMARKSEMCRGCRVFSAPNLVSPTAMSAPSTPVAEAKAALGLPQGPAVFLFIAYNLEEDRKGLLRLVHAVTKLHSKGRRAIVVAIGWKTRKLVLPKWVVLPGFIDSPDDFRLWYQGADAFVSPSLSEGFCKTLLDAAAYGVPAVAFPHSGARETIGEIGGVVTRDFSTDALADGLRLVLDSTWDRQAIRERALAHFSPDFVARRHLEIYQSILAPAAT